jgi:uncharacterized protein/uncharacterized MnhB-related membrane protein
MKKIVLFVCFLFPIAAFAASFDCTKATTPTEKTVCTNPELSSLDEQLAKSYRNVLAVTADQSQLRQAQRTWLTQVLNRCEDTKCLANAYQNRITTLNDGISTSPDKPTSNQPLTSTPEFPPHSNLSAKNTSDSQQSSQSAPAQQTAPSKRNTTELVTEIKQDNDAISSTLMFLGIILLINALTTIYFHNSGKLVIYRDFTDAVFTSIAPLASILIFILLRNFDVQIKNALFSAMCIFVILMYFVAKSTARDNNGLTINFAMSLITKVTIICFYYCYIAVMAAIMFGGSARKKGESYSAYEARKRRDAKESAMLAAATTTGFVALSGWVCKNPNFTPLKDYFVE